jgi:hypothetical protein
LTSAAVRARSDHAPPCFRHRLIIAIVLVLAALSTACDLPEHASTDRNA